MSLEQTLNTDLLYFAPPGLGWQRELHDYRDYSPQSPRVRSLFDAAELAAMASPLPDKVSLREYFPPVYDQGTLPTSTSQACVGLLEYFYCRTRGLPREPSRLFVHQMTCKLLRQGIDCPPGIRSTFRALVRCGAPPELYWPYDLAQWRQEPEAYLFCYSDVFRDLVYFRLDSRNATGGATLSQVRSCLAAGLPVVFGFSVPASLRLDRDIPYRPTFDSIRGGQAVVAVGYDDRRVGPTRGALLVRSSWGSTWGDQGYGWLPYRYVEEQLATDFWTAIHPEWLSTGEFQFPVIETTSSLDHK